MTCFECGAEIGTARGCRRCGAPVPEPRQDDAPVPGPAAQEAAKSPKVVLAWAGIVLLNLLADPGDDIHCQHAAIPRSDDYRVQGELNQSR